MSLENGSIFHGLTILACCGAGAYGEVYYCKDVSGKFLAVKIVSKQMLGTHWQRELQGVINYRRITENAPELLQIFHVEETEDSFFYTMEPADSCVEGEYHPDTLGQRLQAGAIPQDEQLPILKGIFAGIKTIHDAGFAHRDIKPDNILFVKGVPKLGDIGLLSSLSNTMTAIAGTIEFIPPEMRDSPEEQDRPSRQKSDLYALGKVLYCMLTGNEPQHFPSTPENMSISDRQQKLLWQLSLALCNREPLYRLHAIVGIEEELQRIEKILVQGETFKEHLKYSVKHVGLHSIYSFVLFMKGCKKHWILTLLVLLAFGGGAWYLWPKDPYEVKNVKNQQYSNAKLGMSMTIPADWQIMSNETMKKLMAEMVADKKDPTQQEKKYLQLLQAMIDQGTDVIYCSYTGDFGNNININRIPVPGKKFLEAKDDELKAFVRQLIQGEYGMPLDFHKLERVNIAGVPSIQFDYSYSMPERKVRACYTIFCFEKHCVGICLTTLPEVYTETRIKFESVMKTLKFTKK